MSRAASKCVVTLQAAKNLLPGVKKDGNSLVSPKVATQTPRVSFKINE